MVASKWPKSVVNDVMATRLIGVCAQIIGAVCDAISVDRAKADQIVKAQSKVLSLPIGFIMQQLKSLKWFYTAFNLAGKQEWECLSISKMGLVLKPIWSETLKVNLGLDLGDNSQFDAVQIQRAIKDLQTAASGCSG